LNRRTVDWGSPFERDIGYARAVVSGDWVFVSGSTGGDPDTGVMPFDVETQCANTLAKIARALRQAGAGFGDVVRVLYILPAAADFEPCWPQLRAAFGSAPPAATMIVAGLIDPAMRIEIEVTAFRPA
jgi:enamine deaminase RidA (YjgF/YER057c/UK114 family)